MPAPSSFDYAVLRVVPRPDREEFVNAGVILFCLERDYLAARIQLDAARVRALEPDADVQAIEQHLLAIPRIAEGSDGSGPIGRLSRRERFHWLVAPRSTVIQVSPVHSGICDDPRLALERLFDRMIAPASAPRGRPPE